MIAPTDASIPEPIVTSTAEPTAVPSLTEEDKASLHLAETGVGTNNEWAVYTEAINGTEMALESLKPFLNSRNTKNLRSLY